MSQIQELLISLFNEAPVNKLFGMTLEFGADGDGIVRLPRNSHLDHGGGDTHGGVIATMLDAAGWFTVAARAGGVVVTSDIQVHLLQAAKRQDLVATAHVVRIGSKSAVAEMRVSTAAGELVAIATASFAKLGELPSR
jgi:uncharacterized protein (TIGR00369 family)